MTRYGLRIVPLVLPGNREASLTKTQTPKRTGGLERSLWVAPYLVPPNPQLSVCLKKNTATYILMIAGNDARRRREIFT